MRLRNRPAGSDDRLIVLMGKKHSLNERKRICHEAPYRQPACVKTHHHKKNTEKYRRIDLRNASGV